MFHWLAEHYVLVALSAAVDVFLLVTSLRLLKRTASRICYGSLFVMGSSCLVAALFLSQLGHQLSGVPVNHIVLHDAAGYYYKPTGPFDVRYPISPHRAEIFDRYDLYSRWLAPVGGSVLMASLLLGAWLYRRENQSR